MGFQKRFTQKDLDRIKEVVKLAESKISGEIVPVFVERSGYYTIANYRGGIIGIIVFFLLVIFFDRFFPDIAVYDPVLIFVIVMLGGLAGAILPHFNMAIKRLLITKDHLDHSTRKKAENAFLEEEVFNTRHRTGIMLFISFFEREVIVMADRGISKVVEQKEWDNMVTIITGGIKNNKVIDGMETAIKRCGEILFEKGFFKTPDDVNELPDELRVD